MDKKEDQNLSGVAETLLIPLYARAMETERPDCLLQDKIATDLVRRMDYDFERIKQLKIGEDDQAFLILRNREFDRYASDFMDRNPRAAVVHIGCGLDARFERVDNGHVEWFDLDLPEVIELRRRLIGGDKKRYHLLDDSVLNNAWLEKVEQYRDRSFLFLAEGVLMYFEETQVKSMVLTLREYFPGSELVFDAFAPFIVWGNNLRIARTKIGVHYGWGLKRSKDIEGWADGIELLDEWYWGDRSEPRLAKFRWMRFIPPLAKASGIRRFRLGSPK